MRDAYAHLEIQDARGSTRPGSGASAVIQRDGSVVAAWSGNRGPPTDVRLAATRGARAEAERTQKY